jgi:RimJ/RimL family protein N-acetyltransferase
MTTAPVPPSRHRRGFRVRRGDRPWTERLTLDDGRDFVVRPIEPADAPVLAEVFHLLTPEQVRYRFLHPIKELTPAMLRQLTEIDRSQAIALVVAEPGAAGTALIGAVGRAAMVKGSRDAEFGIVVGGPISGRGLGRHLLKRLVHWARLKRLDTLFGTVLADNGPMLDLAARLGFSREHVSGEPGLVRVAMSLPTRRAPPTAARSQ